ncbi:MAG: 4Fe-4S dicluster domain-containing protein [Acidobacteria bacterium]|nr:4Fe-4S dicluster domain-containing protein [Acidobacteriota bacterium]
MAKEETLLHSALNAETDKLLGCIHCGLCLPACPTYLQFSNENDSPRGRIYLMRAVAEGRLAADSEIFSRHIDLCLGCRACETACPAGVRYGSLLEAARETILTQEAKKSAGLQKTMLAFGLRHIFPNPKRLKLVFRLLKVLRNSRVINFALKYRLIRMFSSKAEFALSLLMTSRPTWVGNSQILIRSDASRPVVLFSGCVMDGLFAHANDATRRVLAANDCRLGDVQGQTCCGALHAHAGDMDLARVLARRNINAFEHYLNSGTDPLNPPMIIVNAAGCGALLKEYGELLKDDPHYSERARQFSERVRDVTEYLAQTEIRHGAEIEQRVTFDAPCHLYHAQRVTTAPQRLLAVIPGLEYIPLEGMQDCCGGAGIYNLSEPEMSERLLSDKISKIKATGANILLTANPGCQMQLGAGARISQIDCRVAHIVELLDESYRRAGYYSPDKLSS